MRKLLNANHAFVFVFGLMLTLAGCATDRENGVPSSGDPEADYRAEQRVGSEDERGGKDGKDGRERTLYERLGKEQAIAALVEDFTARVVADPRVNFERNNVRSGFLGARRNAWEPTPEDVEILKRRMVEFIALATGGPTEYTGRSMEEVHKGMKITNAEFDAMIGDIKASMDKLGLGTREKRDLLAIFETTRKQIVEER